MILEKTGMAADYYDEVTTELFDGYIGEAKFLDLRFEMDSEQTCINKALEQMKNFFKEIDFEFSAEDGDKVMQFVRDKAYPAQGKYVDVSIALSSNEKVSYIAVTLLSGKILKISILVNDLRESLIWKNSESQQKELMFYDLFSKKKAHA